MNTLEKSNLNISLSIDLGIDEYWDNLMSKLRPTHEVTDVIISNQLSIAHLIESNIKYGSNQ